MDVMEKASSKKRLIDYYYLAEKIECPGVPLVYWDDIEAAPIVDAVPVVRCSDCRKFKTYGCRMVASGYDDFCSYGERKEGAD